MTQEEKVKAYDEALERMKSWVKGEHPECFGEAQKAAEFIFPELKEIEDDRIKKEILNLVSISGNGNQFEEIKDWLEKQGKSEVKYVYTKFQVGDVIVEIEPNGYCPPVMVKHIKEGAYSCESNDKKRFLSFPITSQDKYKLVKQEPADLPNSGECDVDSLYHAVWILEKTLCNLIKVVNHLYKHKHIWSEEDKKILSNIGKYLNHYGNSIVENNEDKAKDVYKLVDWLKSL